MKKSIKWLVISLVAIIVLVALAGMYKFNYLANQEGYDVDGNKIRKENEVKEENIWSLIKGTHPKIDTGLSVIEADCNKLFCNFSLDDGKNFKVEQEDNVLYEDYYNVIKIGAEVELLDVDGKEFMITFIGTEPKPDPNPKMPTLTIRGDIKFFGYLVEK